jgi:hypothetical protein
MRLRLVAVLAAFSFLSFACHSTYLVEQTQFAKLQRAGETPVQKVEALSGAEIEVTTDSKIFVRSTGGRRYPITPFNFMMTGSQLVAPDRDYILMTDGIGAYEVDVPNANKTIMLIAGGVLAIGGAITFVILSSGEKSVQ